MAIELPFQPRPQLWTPAYIPAGNDLAAPVGGATQRILRLGDRWAITAAFLKVKYEFYGRQWRSRLAQATSDTATWALPTPMEGVGSPGAPVVNGAGQAGRILNLRGLTVGYVFYEGQFFSFITAGRHYLHQVAGDAIADGSGHVALSFIPMLRVSPADGDTIEVTQPVIEGLCERNPSFPTSINDVIDFGFTITESK